MLESDHSIDIIKRDEVSKLNIIQDCIRQATVMNKSTQFICIGDKGKWPGNDYDLLSCNHALSVDEVSLNPETCWNISSVGVKNADATLEYLKQMVIVQGNILFK